MSLARTVRTLVAVSAFAALAVAPATARASDPDAARIVAAGHALKWNWTPPGHADRYGHAETLIHAPITAVRVQVQDFAKYKDFVPSKFKVSKVVGKQGGSTDVYIQIAVMHGMVSLWNVTRFAPPKQVSPGVEVVEGKMVPGKGNVKDVDVVWTMRSISPEWTILKFDLLMKPDMPAPQSAIDEELRDSALYAVDAIHDRAQGSCGIAPYSG
jgi:hypothetical protein